MAAAYGSVELHQLGALLERGAQLVEVLPEDEYQWGHLPGAINVPLKALAVEALTGLDRRRPIAVYCWDAL